MIYTYYVDSKNEKTKGVKRVSPYVRSYREMDLPSLEYIYGKYHSVKMKAQLGFAREHCIRSFTL